MKLTKDTFAYVKPDQSACDRRYFLGKTEDISLQRRKNRRGVNGMWAKTKATLAGYNFFVRIASHMFLTLKYSVH